MNVYLLFALAFGAMTGVADLAAPRTAAVTIRVRDERRVSVAGCRLPVMSATHRMNRRPSAGERFVAVVPLTGSISPRAPAANC